MKNQSGEIPNAFQDAWNNATEELRQASLELNAANERYMSAIRARLAIIAAVNESQN